VNLDLHLPILRFGRVAVIRCQPEVEPATIQAQPAVAGNTEGGAAQTIKPPEGGFTIQAAQFRGHLLGDDDPAYYLEG
jgi:hypothetical protein